ncbi:MAG: TIR domain-containing protein [Calditrichaeota bacterium]|nr:MAG: TIR domain-containing protein [Calditrichota bacterium]
MGEKNQVQEYDAFISYSRKDKEFAIKLEKALENFKPPKIQGVPQRHLKIFRDEEDLSGTEYFQTIDNSLANAKKLLVICSPSARESDYVNDEIRRFVEKNKPADIIPILLDGIPNNEANQRQKRLMAFPEALTDVMEMPLAVSFLNTDWQKKNITRGQFKNAWYTILSNIYNINRDKLEERDRLRRRKQLQFIFSLISGVMLVLIALTVWALLSEKEVRELKFLDNNFSRAKLYEELAGQKLLSESKEGFQKAWLYTLGALAQEVTPGKNLSISKGRLYRKNIATGAGMEQLMWVSPRPPQKIIRFIKNPRYPIFATISTGNEIGLWDISSGEQLQFLFGHTAPLVDVAFSSDGAFLASVAKDSTIRFWQINDNREVKQAFLFHTGNNSITEIGFLPDSKTLISVGKDGLLQSWEMPDHGWKAKLKKLFLLRNQGKHEVETTLRNKEGQPFSITSFAITPDRKILAGDVEGRLYLWEWGAEPPAPLPLDDISPVQQIITSPLGRCFAFSSNNGKVSLLDAQSGLPLFQTSLPGSHLVPMTFVSDSLLVIGDQSGGILLVKQFANTKWDTWRKIPLKGEPMVACVAISEKNHLLTSHDEGIVRMWDLMSGELLAETEGHLSEVNDIALFPGDSILAAASNRGDILLWNVNTGVLLDRWEGNGSVVLGIDVSPDGKTLVSGGKDNVIRIWDTETGNIISRLNGHTAHVWSVAFSPDGHQIVSAGKDGSVRIWNLTSGREIHTFYGHRGGAFSASFSSDGKYIISAGRDSSLVLWSLDTSEAPIRWHAHSNIIWKVKISPNDSLIASASKDETIGLWNMKDITKFFDPENDISAVIPLTEKKNYQVEWPSVPGDSVVMTRSKEGWNVATLKSGWHWLIPLSPKTKLQESGENGQRWEILFDRRNRLLAYRVKDGRIELRCGENIATLLKGHLDDVWDICFSPDGKLLASASDDETIRLWSIHNAGELATLNGHEDDVSAIQFSSLGDRLFSGSFDHTIRIWDVPRSFQFKNFITNNDTVRSVAFTPDGSQFAYVGHDKRIHLYDMNSRKRVRIPPRFWDWSPLQSVAFHPRLPFLAYGSMDDRIRLWNYRAMEKIILLGHKGDGLTVAFSPDGKYLASGSSDGTLRVWDVAKVLRGERKELFQLTRHEDKIRAVTFAPSGKWMASASSDKKIILWEISKEGKFYPKRTLKGHLDGVWDVAFSPSGKLLASASWDGQIRIWDVATGEKNATLRPQRGPVLSVGFLSDSLLVSGTYARSIHIWNIYSGREMERFTYHNGPVYSLDVSPDRKFLISGSADKTVRIKEFGTRDALMDTLSWKEYKKIFQAYQHWLPYRFDNFDIKSRKPLSYLQTLGDYTFPEPGPQSAFRQPRPTSQNPLEWVLNTFQASY